MAGFTDSRGQIIGKTFYIPIINYYHNEENISRCVLNYINSLSDTKYSVARIDIRRRTGVKNNIFKMAFIHLDKSCGVLYNAIKNGNVNLTIDDCESGINEFWMLLNYTSNQQHYIPSAEYYDKTIAQYEETQRLQLSWINWYAYQLKQFQDENNRLKTTINTMKEQIVPDIDNLCKNVKRRSESLRQFRERETEPDYHIVSPNEVNAKGFPTTGGLRLPEN